MRGGMRQARSTDMLPLSNKQKDISPKQQVNGVDVLQLKHTTVADGQNIRTCTTPTHYLSSAAQSSSSFLPFTLIGLAPTPLLPATPLAPANPPDAPPGGPAITGGFFRAAAVDEGEEDEEDRDEKGSNALVSSAPAAGLVGAVLRADWNVSQLSSECALPASPLLSTLSLKPSSSSSSSTTTLAFVFVSSFRLTGVWRGAAAGVSFFFFGAAVDSETMVAVSCPSPGVSKSS